MICWLCRLDVACMLISANVAVNVVVVATGQQLVVMQHLLMQLLLLPILAVLHEAIVACSQCGRARQTEMMLEAEGRVFVVARVDKQQVVLL